LDPNGHKAGMTAYYHVDNIKQSLQSLLDSGAQIQQEIEDETRMTRKTAARAMATINNLVPSLLALQGFRNFAQARRFYDAQRAVPNFP
jgi:hypothetical protein